MRRFLVRDRRSRIAIDFDKEEAGGIVELLENIESLDSRLLQTRAGVSQGCILESDNGLGSDVDVNMNNEHVGCERFQSARSGAVIPSSPPSATACFTAAVRPT